MKIVKIKQTYVGMPVYYKWKEHYDGEIKRCHGIIVSIDEYKGSIVVHFCDGEYDEFHEGSDLELHDLYATVAK